jgi:hypothetical protein
VLQNTNRVNLRNARQDHPCGALLSLVRSHAHLRIVLLVPPEHGVDKADAMENVVWGQNARRVAAPIALDELQE